MAYFLNKNLNNNEFVLMSKDKYFVDKTRLITLTNGLVGRKERFICITRPRRFGKTVNAMMLASYYSKSTNFKNLFDKLEVSKSKSYLEHLNKHKGLLQMSKIISENQIKTIFMQINHVYCWKNAS